MNPEPCRRVATSLATLTATLFLICCTDVSAYNAVAASATGTLVRFDTAQPGVVSPILTITGLAPGQSVIGIDTRPTDRKLYALTKNASGLAQLYTVDIGSGAATLVATLTANAGDPYTSLTGTRFGIAFNPTVDRLRVVSNSGQNLRLNPTTAIVFTDVSLNPGTPSIVGVAYTNSFALATTTTLYDIDSTSASLLIQNPPNAGVLVAVGPLGFPISSQLGFDIVFIAPDNFAYAMLNSGGTEGLYTINLVTGAATIVGFVGGNFPAIGMAILPDEIFGNGYE